jgi:hypothetical protein
MSESRAEKTLKPKSKSKKGKSKKHKIRAIHISPTDNDAFVAQHDYQPDEEGNTPPSTTHALGDVDQLQQHLADHLGGGAPAGGGEPAPAEAAPAPAAGPGGM